MRGLRSSTEAKPSEQFRVVQAQPEHGHEVHEIVCLANDFPVGTRGCVSAANLAAMVRRFPEGQLVVVTDAPEGERVVGVALTMRTDYPPSARPLSWMKMVGDLDLAQHDPAGRWLYGVEKAVQPPFQGRGVASALYKAQFALAERLGLAGMYAGGMLKGYAGYREHLSVREYAGKVMRGEVFDPTVSVQMKRGFQPRTLIENYAWDHQADHTGMLIVWERPAAGRPREIPRGTQLEARP